MLTARCVDDLDLVSRSDLHLYIASCNLSYLSDHRYQFQDIHWRIMCCVFLIGLLVFFEPCLHLWYVYQCLSSSLSVSQSIKAIKRPQWVDMCLGYNKVCSWFSYDLLVFLWPDLA